MKFNFANRLLRNAEPEALGGGGAGAAIIDFPAAPAATAPAGETPAAAAPAAAAVEPSGGQSAATPPSLLERVSASIQSKGKLLADCNAATLRATTAEARADKAEAALTLANSDLAKARAELSGIETALTTALAEKQEVDTAAATQVAALGFEPAALPAASSADEETKDQLVARLETETDNDKRFALAARINAMN